MDNRPPLDDYFMEIAQIAARRGSCERSKVGAVIVKDGAIISTGYNGSARGEKSCLEVGCFMVDGHCVRCVHAEENAIINAARTGVSTMGSTIFCTYKPCDLCSRRIINSGIKEVVYLHPYKGYGSIDISEYIDIVRAHKFEL